ARAADPTPTPDSTLTPSPGAAVVNRAGTTFLTATAVAPGQPVSVAGSTGDYLYWSFTATAGQTDRVAITVTLPPKGRTGGSTWTVDVFDGLRRRQACTDGAQTPTVNATAGTVSLGCTLRQIRGWAEPWSGDPLPGTYYVRLSVTDLPEADLGLPVRVDMLINAEDGDDPGVEGGRLRAPLAPPARPGSALTVAPTPDPSATPEAGDGTSFVSLDWLPDLSSRWIWTTVGGVLAAIAGVVGFSLTWRRR
ncbi:peptidase, partial [Micromonospora zhanjiangensis]